MEDVMADNDPMVEPTPEPAPVVNYADDMESLIEFRCLACHGNGTSPNLVGFANAKAKAGRMNARVQAGTMPPGNPLSAEEQALFQAWIDGGVR